MRVATYNLHAGVDGYGRGNDVIASALALSPDLLFAQEVWCGVDEDQFATLCCELAADGRYVALGSGERVTGATGGRGWQSPWALVRGEEGLYFDERRELTAHQRERREQAVGRQEGTWGLALITRLPVETLTVETLPQLRRDKVQRALVVARLHSGDTSFYAVSIHGAHLTHGSLLQFRHVARRLDELSAQLPVVVGGDFNCWRPLLRTVLRGWRSGVRARTWPAWRPHSQIDHLLFRGPWTLANPRAVTGPSDHRALVVDATLD